jgi:hypothetical protein
MSIDDATPEEWNRVHQTLKRGRDDVSSPAHYNKGSIECIEAIEAASTKEEFEGYLRSNVIKYIWRFRYKDNIKDLKKAKWYLEKLIEEVGNV